MTPQSCTNSNNTTNNVTNLNNQLSNCGANSHVIINNGVGNTHNNPTQVLPIVNTTTIHSVGLSQANNSAPIQAMSSVGGCGSNMVSNRINNNHNNSMQQMPCNNMVPTSSNGPINNTLMGGSSTMPAPMNVMNCGPSVSQSAGPPPPPTLPPGGVASHAANPMNSNSAPNHHHGGQHALKMSMEQQYGQQTQGPLFIFSTTLANEAAEAVQKKQVASLIDYHMSLPSTQKYIDENPSKGPIRQGPNWPSASQMNQMHNAANSNNLPVTSAGNKRIKQSLSPQMNNNTNSPFNYRPPSNSGPMANYSGNFRPGPSPGMPNEMTNWHGPNEMGWQSPHQHPANNNNFGQMMPNNGSMRMMPGAPGSMPPGQMPGKKQYLHTNLYV